ncbi:Glycine cleavage system H protein 2, mitochondrial [Vitis vinifera]|uniref:Glycine cleavage system H protein 2, mitochondrial n=1 Tax=Vitis vinifera TaxID=29760 RepID=A0A438FZ00_VITVI|nr:Glycine cleavage system H protein 2, mitochondrial [Vitis vinifera]
MLGALPILPLPATPSDGNLGSLPLSQLQVQLQPTQGPLESYILLQTLETLLTRLHVVKDLKYADSHEWVKIDGNSAIGSSFGAVESVKATSDINSPVSGKVVEVKEELNSSPGLLSPQMLVLHLGLFRHFIGAHWALLEVNASQYENGWIIKVEMSDTGELNSLDSEQYTKFCEEEDAKH